MTKLCTFVAKGKTCLGMAIGNRVADLNLAIALSREEVPRVYWPSMTELLAAGPDGIQSAKQAEAFLADKGSVGSGVVFSLNEINFRPPVQRPPKILCLVGNYASHVREAIDTATSPDDIMVFTKTPGVALIGHEDPVLVANWIEKLDYEVELGIVIGVRGRYIPYENALEHVAGYTVCNDISDRTYLETKRGNDWFAMKSQDSFGPMGPYIVPAEDLPPAADGLGINLTVNGETRQNSTTSDMIFGVADLVHRISRLVTLEVGDIIETGTPAGPVGMSQGRLPYLRDGDVLEGQIEGIGLLRNRIVFEEPVYRKS